jgi:hypothetical protein
MRVLFSYILFSFNMLVLEGEKFIFRFALSFMFLSIRVCFYVKEVDIAYHAPSQVSRFHKYNAGDFHFLYLQPFNMNGCHWFLSFKKPNQNEVLVSVQTVQKEILIQKICFTSFSFDLFLKQVADSMYHDLSSGHLEQLMQVSVRF